MVRFLDWALEFFPFIFFCGLIRLGLHYLGWLEISDGRLALVQIFTGIILVFTLGKMLFKKYFQAGPQDAGEVFYEQGGSSS